MYIQTGIPEEHLAVCKEAEILLFTFYLLLLHIKTAH